MKVLKQGTNGWTCIPDGPSPGVDPMCLDKNGMEWADAWMNHKDPPKDKMAIGYMLMGGSDASNTDPFATEPKSGDKWVDTGPHMMVMNIGDHFAGYPTTADEHESAVRDVRGHAVRALDDSGEVSRPGAYRGPTGPRFRRSTGRRTSESRTRPEPSVPTSSTAAAPTRP